MFSSNIFIFIKNKSLMHLSTYRGDRNEENNHCWENETEKEITSRILIREM